MNEIDKFHSLAKDAGNKLRAYILSVSSGGTVTLFFALINNDKVVSISDKWLLLISLLSFVLTVVISLYELRVDAHRFFKIAKELEKPENIQSWEENERLKRKRFFLIHSTYITLGIGILCVSIFLTLKILNT